MVLERDFSGKFDRVSATFQRPGHHRVTWFELRVSQMGDIDGIAQLRDISYWYSGFFGLTVLEHDFSGKFDRVSAMFQRPGQHRVTWFVNGVSQMGGIDGIAVLDKMHMWLL